MQQRPNITLENYAQFKPSELIACGIIDLQNAIGAGFKIEMGSWFGLDERSAQCTVCLGGAALCGMNEEIQELMNKGLWIFATEYMDRSENALEIALLFDEVRTGSIDLLVNRLIKLYSHALINFDETCKALTENWNPYFCYGKLQRQEIGLLIQSIQSLVAILEKIGL